jgi:WD40 repeat protein
MLTGYRDGTIVMWRLQDAKPVYTLKGHKGPVYSLAKGGKNLISGAGDGSAIMWDLKKGQKL